MVYNSVCKYVCIIYTKCDDFDSFGFLLIIYHLSGQFTANDNGWEVDVTQRQINEIVMII